nr:Calx-beta domain-containing protein [Synechococcus sp. CCY 0621]
MWKLDGSGNPVLVKDINAGSGSSSPSQLIGFDGRLFFTANNGTSGVELWSSDGTDAGTVLQDLFPGATSSSVSDFTIAGGVLYFVATGSTSSRELWRVNPGSAAAQLIDVQPGSGGSSPTQLVSTGSQLFFRASTVADGAELWTIDPATGNPQLISINTGTASSSPDDLTAVGGILYFTASSPATGNDLWSYDPSTATLTSLEVNPGSTGSNPSNLLAANGTLFFTAAGSGTGVELWKLDPTTGLPVLVKDITPGPLSTSFSGLTSSNGKVYFSISSVELGTELWESDGTGAGTFLTADLNLTTAASTPQDFVVAGGRFFFTADDGANGRQLWVVPAAGAAAQLVSSTLTTVNQLLDVGGTLYFEANDGTTGNELWRLPPGSLVPELIDLSPGAGSSSPANLTLVGSTLYFTASVPGVGTELLRIDAATGSPVVIDVLPGSSGSSPSNLINANGSLFFVANSAASGRELWTIDAATGDAVFLTDINPGTATSNPGSLTFSNNKLYFSATDGVQGIELWAVDVVGITILDTVEKTSDEDELVAFTAGDFAAAFTSGSGLPLATVRIVGLPSNGILKLNGVDVTAGQEIAAADLAQLSFSPALNFNGSAAFLWNGSDGIAFADEDSLVSFTINPVNDAPVLNIPLIDRSIFSNRLTTFSFPANSFTDVDLGDSLTYSATLEDGSPLPGWLSLGDRVFTADPLIADASDYVIAVTATDQSNASVTDLFSLSVVNSQPTNISLDNSQIAENTANDTLIGTLTSQDSNSNDTHTYTLFDDAGGRFSIVGDQLLVADGSLLNFEADTQHLITVQTTDSSGLSFQRNLIITILNVVDDNRGVLAFSQPQFSVNEDGSPISAVTIERTGGSEGIVSVNLVLSDGVGAGAATFPGDYSTQSLTVIFQDSETSRTVDLPIFDDTLSEGPESFALTLVNPTNGATLGAQSAASVIIVDNDKPAVSLSLDPLQVTEDGTAVLTYTFSRTGVLNDPLTVNFSVAGAASLNSDYSVSGATTFSALAGSVVIPAGLDTFSVVIDPSEDTSFEPDEDVILTLVSDAAYMIATPGPISGLILNDDGSTSTLAFSAGAYSVNEDGTTSQAITITRTGSLAGSVSATLTLTPGTATPGADYDPAPIPVVFADQQAVLEVVVPIVNDGDFEPEETLFLSLGDPQSGASIGAPNTATLTIVSDDPPQPGSLSFGAATYTVNENGVPAAEITVVRSGGTDGLVGATISFLPGSATAPGDYLADPIAVVFGDGEGGSQTILLPITDDAVFEPTESFIITLGAPTGGVAIGGGTAAITILDDEPLPAILGLPSSALVLSEDGLESSFALVLSTQPTADVVISFSPDGQVSLDRTSLTFTDQDWNIPQTVIVSAIDDPITEGPHPGVIQPLVSSADPAYAALVLADLSAAIEDNDAEIIGQVWNDANNNGIDDTEAPIPGWTVFLDADGNGVLDPGERSVVTGADGAYRFDDLRPGTYAVAQVVEPGWLQTFPATGALVDILAGEVAAGIDFGNFLLPVDTTPPTATIELDTTALASGQSALVTISFSEAVQGFALDDLSAGSAGLSDLTPQAGSGGQVWTALLTPDAGVTTTGNVVELADGSYTDLAGNPGGGAISPPYDVDTLVPPTYTVSPLAGTVNEGEQLAIELRTTNVAAGTPVYWQLSGAGLTASDLGDGQLSGDGSIGSDGRFTVIRSFAADASIEGEELFELRFFSDAAFSQQVGGTSVLTIQEPVVGPPTDGSDSIIGTAAAEIISGVPGGSSLRGRGTIDELTGGGSGDLFILGDETGIFYDDGNGFSQGRGDFGVINDFGADDKIQLHGAANQYLLGLGTYQSQLGTFIYSRNPSRPLSPRVSFFDEAIGFVKGLTPSALDLTNASQFTYVQTDLN